MRAIILILIVIVVAIIAAVATGFLNINQVRGGQVPQVSATGNGIVAKGGQAPAFDVEAGTVRVGSKPSTVKVPSVEVVRPGSENQAANSATNAQ
jgi:flagellar basal body-associated protein FliL